MRKYKKKNKSIIQVGSNFVFIRTPDVSLYVCEPSLQTENGISFYDYDPYFKFQRKYYDLASNTDVLLDIISDIRKKYKNRKKVQRALDEAEKTARWYSGPRRLSRPE